MNAQRAARAGMPAPSLRRNGLPWMLVLACLLAGPAATAAAAQENGKDGNIEFAAWHRAFSGKLGGKDVQVNLELIDTRLSGWYCYGACAENTPLQLQLDGKLARDRIELVERDQRSRRPAAPTGRWSVVLENQDLVGRWRSPDGKRVLPLRLHAQPAFPFQMRLVASALPADTGDCDDEPRVSAIRLYRNGKLVQTLETDAQDGSCRLFVPTIVDANFDGWPDLTIATATPAGPNIPYQTWLYDAARGRFVDAPPALQAITSPEFDATQKTIVSQWRNGCCEHGVTTYRWHGNALRESGRETSRWLPVLAGRRRLYCYVIPAYQDGRIDYPDRVERRGERLSLTFDDFSNCESRLVMSPEPAIDIWETDPAGKQRRVRTETTRWKQVAGAAGGQWCPEVPFFSAGTIRRIVIQNDPEQPCSATRP